MLLLLPGVAVIAQARRPKKHIAPHQHFSQQYRYFTPNPFNYWGLGVHGGRVDRVKIHAKYFEIGFLPFKVTHLVVQIFSINRRTNQAPPESTCPALQQ